MNIVDFIKYNILVKNSQKKPREIVANLVVSHSFLKNINMIHVKIVWKKEREIAREKRKNARINSTIKIIDGVEYKTCTICCKECEISQFKTDKDMILKTCNNCRNRNNRAVRQNIEQVKAREKELEENNPARQYHRYKNSAKTRGIELQLTFEEYYDIVKNPCYYCGDLHKRGFNGLDRIHPNLHYTMDNVVSCCTICNYLKNSLDITTFYHRIKHILSYNKLIDLDVKHPESFSNHIKINYKGYINGAKDRNIEIIISSEEFYKIISHECYICGKQNETGIHQNGIDRFDNSVGYTLENCRPCCGGCNIMKNKHNYIEFMNKLVQIYNHFVYDETIKNHNSIVNNVYFKKVR